MQQPLTRVQAICIAPSRELALQILSVVQKMGAYTPVECFFAGRDSVVKGMPSLTQQIIVGTPGTIIEVSARFDHQNFAHYNFADGDEASSSGSLARRCIRTRRSGQHAGSGNDGRAEYSSQEVSRFRFESSR